MEASKSFLTTILLQKDEEDYISKDYDYADVNSDIVTNLQKGQPSDRYNDLKNIVFRSRN